MKSFTIDATTGYVAPKQSVRVSNKVGQVSNHSDFFRFGAVVMFIAAALVAANSFAVVG